MKKFYNAIFTPEQEGGYTITFPDVKGAVSYGETMEEAYEMAFDVLGLMLLDNNENFVYPKASIPNEIELNANEFIVAIHFDELEYLKKHGQKAVNKTITLPQWLNTMAQSAGINFSQTLQKALKNELGLE